MKIALAAVLLFSPALHAAPCDSDQYRQFDFWVGEWEVTTPDGKVAGTNRITVINRGCALLEEWTGAGGMTGKSLNAYDRSRAVWHQTWVDSNGLLLQIEGRFENGAMRLSSKTDRITWTPLKGGDVRQEWEQTDDGGKSWKRVFDGRYRRK